MSYVLTLQLIEFGYNCFTVIVIWTLATEVNAKLTLVRSTFLGCTYGRGQLSIAYTSLVISKSRSPMNQPMNMLPVFRAPQSAKRPSSTNNVARVGDTDRHPVHLF
jgi:hypothetical protein